MEPNKSELFTYLKDIGCCDICCLRFLKVRDDNYLDAAGILSKLELSYKKEDDNETTVKRAKPNPCVACLGVFSTELIDEVVSSIIKDERLQSYDIPTASTTFSLPLILHLRQLTIWIGLLDKFTGMSDTDPPFISIKEIYRQVLNQTLAKSFDRQLDTTGLQINIFFSHADDKTEMKSLTHVNPGLFHERATRKQYNKEFMTRNAFEKHFIPSKVNIKRFKSNITVPPTVPATALKLDKITLTGPTVHVAGRYCKFSRNLCQSPWILEGKKVMEDSVQEIIAAQIAPVFGIKPTQVVFMASGREDVDVRCLGKGRPFVIEIPDAKKLTLLEDEIAHIKETVNESKRVTIRDLQIVNRDELFHIKTGEENKKKFYRALCVTEKAITGDLMKKLQIPNGFEIKQITPIRVLHRRTLLERPRMVYSLKGYAVKDKPNALILDVVTQAGTYIKELVHGEFGRTEPSIQSIIGQPVDIISLDVLAIDLDWPPEIIEQNEIVSK